MKRSIYILILAFVSYACTKEDDGSDGIVVNEFRMMQLYNGSPDFIIAGDGFVCLNAYRSSSNFDQNYMIFSGSGGGVQSQSVFTGGISLSVEVLKVFFEEEESLITLFYGNNFSRLRIRTNGEPVDTIPDFLKGLEPIPSGQSIPASYKVQGMEILDDGKYAVFGYLEFLNRAFFSLHNPDGSQIFKKFYLQGAPEMNSFTGFAQKPDGTYLLFGSHNSNSPESPPKLFLINYDQKGGILNEHVMDYDDGYYDEDYIFSKELIPHANGTYTCVVNRPDLSDPNQYVEFLTISEEDEIVDRQILDFAPTNVSVKFTTKLGQSNYGIIDQVAFDQRGAYSYWVELDAFGKLVQSSVVDARSNASLTALTVRNNQELVLAGAHRSFGDSLKPFYTVVRP